MKTGATRIVFLVGSYALKIPSMHSWQTFLWGLLGNMQERLFWTTRWPELCPVLFSLPGGWLVVMSTAQPLTDEEGGEVPEDWCERGEYVVPAEMKRDSFGVLNGKIVAIDYGS